LSVGDELTSYFALRL